MGLKAENSSQRQLAVFGMCDPTRDIPVTGAVVNPMRGDDVSHKMAKR